MLYSIIKAIIKVGFYFFCRTININQPQFLNTKGPLLLTINHPNALIDAIVIGLLFKQPIHFLTRGDAFNKPWKRKILNALNMIAIYRLRDGVENLHLNQFAFDTSLAILKNNGIVLIFIEGICKHTHELQPFKKGAARIALNCWQQNIPLRIMPIVIHYSSLQKFIQHIQIAVLKPISQNEFGFDKQEAKNYLIFNSVLQQKMNGVLHEIAGNNNPYSKSNFWFYTLKAICFPIIKPIDMMVMLKTNGTVFYHSILFAVLLVVVPLYLIMLISTMIYFLF